MYRPAVTRPQRKARTRERGQMVPLMAIFAIVLLGCTAIATDLSVGTHYQRNLQNLTDAAALEGAKQLPLSPTLSDQEKATEYALDVLHNTFPWGGATPASLATSGCFGSRCSVTVCAGLSGTGCAGGVSQGSVPAFSLTVNTPPKTALNATFNSSADPDYLHRVEVVMHEKSGGYFAGIFGISNEIAGAQSVAFHYAPGQPFPFALFSNTYVADGNSPEIISGNVYASRFLTPQSTSAQNAICVTNDANGNPGYIVLGAPQQGDSGYANDGQYRNPQVASGADPMIENFSQPCTNAANGSVNMSANPQSTSDCQSAFGSVLSGSSLVYDTYDHTCEAQPALQSPQPAALPGAPSYAGTTQCPNYVTTPDPQAGTFQCNGNNKPSLLISSSTYGTSTITPGIYAIKPSGNWPCDVVIDGSYTNLTGVTFYLMHDPSTGEGAGICAGPPGGVTIQQTPYVGVYDVYSDGSATNPQVQMTTLPGVPGGGSGSGIWQMAGVIWLPTGTVTIQNSYALQVTGQCLVNSWIDKSGKHLNPSITYNGQNVPPLPEQLRLVE